MKDFSPSFGPKLLLFSDKDQLVAQGALELDPVD